MSFLDNVNLKSINLKDLNLKDNANSALVSLGLRDEPKTMADLILPGLAIFGAGVACGAVIGLLVAPQTGRELRQDIKSKAGDLQQNVRKALPAGLRGDNHVGEESLTGGRPVSRSFSGS
jgi:hypothetical protein